MKTFAFGFILLRVVRLSAIRNYDEVGTCQILVSSTGETLIIKKRKALKKSKEPTWLSKK